MSSNKTERLLSLALSLLEAQRNLKILSRTDLRQWSGDYPADASDAAFERMFERDKDDLRALGINIETVETDDEIGSGYVLSRKQTYLPKLDLTPAESLVLGLAARMWDQSGWAGDPTNALSKIERVTGFWTESDTSGFTPSVHVNGQVLASLASAIGIRQPVEFEYRKSASGTPEKRRVQGWGIVAMRGQWYLVGHDLDRAEQRSFRLSRIASDIGTQSKKSSMAPGSYELPEGVVLRELIATDYPGNDPVDIVLALKPAAALRLRALADPDTDFDTADRVQLSAVDPDKALQEILAAGDEVTVLRPEWLRERTTNVLRSLACAPSSTLQDADRASLAKVAKLASKATVETAQARLSRLLALVPWLQAHPGITWDQAAEHFGITADLLRDDVNLAICTEFSINHITLDIDAFGETITVRDPQGIENPLQFTPVEAVSLLLGLKMLAAVPGPHDRSALATVTAKIAKAAGSAAALVDHVVVTDDFGSADQACIDEIHTAMTNAHAIRIDYHGGATDQVTQRVIDPLQILTVDAQSYLHAWCRNAQALRMFRIDRIQRLVELDEALELPVDVTFDAGLNLAGTAAVFELDSSVAWWVEQTPSLAHVRRENGTWLVELSIASREWAIRTVLGFAGRVRVLEPANLAEELRLRAASALTTYTTATPVDNAKLSTESATESEK